MRTFSFILTFFLYSSLSSSLDIYIAPFNFSFPCQSMTKGNTCNGSKSNPFDDMRYAFQFGVNNSLETLNFKFISNSNQYFYLNMSTTKTLFSPFDNFSGLIFFF